MSRTEESEQERRKQRERFRQALQGAQLEQIFDYLPGIYFVVKNREGLVMLANQLATNLCGMKTIEEMIGKSDHDIFPPEQAAKYVKDDQQVFDTGKPIIDRIELAPDPMNAINWFFTTKLPLHDRTGAVIGLACIARTMENDNEKARPYAAMNEVLECIRLNYASPLRIEDLAALANLSSGQFERNFKKVFGIPPKQHLLNVRIQAASHLLRSTHSTIAAIANDTGFYDHSHFCRCFKKELGVSPGEYRRQ